jgi:hypothetical protein
MKTNTSLHADHQLDQLAGPFDHWRQNRSHHGECIPQPLWDQAATLAQMLPYTRVATHLHLSARALKAHMAGRQGVTSAPPSTPPPFVEVPTAPPCHRPLRPWRSSLSDPMRRVYACAAPSPPHPWPPWCGPFWRGRDDPTPPTKPHLFGHRTCRLSKRHRRTRCRMPTAPGR